MRTRIALAVLAAGLSAGSQAWAAKPQAREKQAKKACLSGDYVKGVSILADLFVDTGDPNYLYNQGRCYEQNVRYVEAAERFKEYLRKVQSLSPADRADTEKHIADCEAAAAKARQGLSPSAETSQPPAMAQPAASAAPPPSAAAPIPPAGSIAPPPAGLATSTAPMMAPEEHPWQHTAKWIATGAAVAFLGLGVAEHVRYYGKNRDFNNDPICPSNPNASECKSLASSADTAQIVAFIGYGAAAAATAAAVVFFATDSPKSRASAPSPMGFTCVPALAGLACQGRF